MTPMKCVACCFVGVVASSSSPPDATAGSGNAAPTASTVSTVSTTEAAPDTEAAPQTFTSTLYGYSMTVPAGWNAVPARIVWDGDADPGHDTPMVDRMFAPSGAAAWAYAQPVDTDLESYTASRNLADNVDHDCPLVPETSEPIVIDGETGVLQSKQCGILVMSVQVIHDGVAYSIYMQDYNVEAASDADDLAVFHQMLDSVDLPGLRASSSAATTSDNRATIIATSSLPV